MTDSSAAPMQITAQDTLGQAISAERQAELQAILDAWNVPGADHGDRKGPFDVSGLSNEERERDCALAAPMLSGLGSKAGPTDTGAWQIFIWRVPTSAGVLWVESI